MKIDISLLKKGDSIYIRSTGWISNAIAFVSSGGSDSPNIPSHEAKIYNIDGNNVKLIEVIFSGKRFYNLEDYINQGARVWVKRDNIVTDNNVGGMLNYMENLKVKGYDIGLITGFLLRFMLRKLIPWKWNWVTHILDSKILFVCSEYCDAGRRFLGMVIDDNSTPYDDVRKVPAVLITTYNV